MATTTTAAIAIEKSHREALEVVRELGNPENAERVEYLDNLGIYLGGTRDTFQTASAQSVLIGALARIVEDQASRLANQDRRITELENAAPPATAASSAEPGRKKAGGKG